MANISDLLGPSGVATKAQGVKADTAHGWGDHALAGYLTSYTVTQGDVTAHEGALSIGWAQVTGAPAFITGYTVTEVDVTTHEAALSIGWGQVTGKPTITAFAETILDDADAGAVRATLGMAAVASSGAYADLTGTPDETTLANGEIIGAGPYNLDAIEAAEMKYCSNAGGVTFNIRANATAAIPTDTFFLFTAKNAVGITIDAVAGVTIDGVDGGAVTVAENQSVMVHKVGTDAWRIVGGFATV